MIVDLSHIFHSYKQKQIISNFGGNMKNEVFVSKGLAETLKKKREEKEMREYLRRLLFLERASRPIKRNGKLIITEQASKARILLEIYNSSIGAYSQVWKDLVDCLKDWPSDVETVQNQLSKNEREISDEEAIASLEKFVGEINGLLDKAKKLRQEIIKRDEEIKQYADSITPGSDVATPASIDLDQIETPQDIAPTNQEEGGEDKAKIGVEDL
jgi:hypothetical protein